MSVLIKGMEMPKCCADCPFDYDCFCCAITLHNFFIIDEHFDFTKERAFDCPLIEVPQHGRLIDADKLLTYKTDHETISTHLVWNAPTVIESEE